MFSSFVCAEASYTFKQGEPIDLKIPVYDDANVPATNAITCTLNVLSPTQEVIVTNGAMTFNTGGIYNYTIPAMTELGEYPSSMSCTDGSISGFVTFGFEVTASGASQDMQTSIIQTLIIPAVGNILALILIAISFMLTSEMAAKSLRYAGVIIAALNLYVGTMLGANVLFAILSAGMIAIGVGSLIEGE